MRAPDNENFAAQAGTGRRRWLCVGTRDVDVCTAHLNTGSCVEVAGKDTQCAGLAVLLARRAPAHRCLRKEVNRRRSCAPDGAWTRQDRSASPAPGLQHVYGSRAVGARGDFGRPLQSLLAWASLM